MKMHRLASATFGLCIAVLSFEAALAESADIAVAKATFQEAKLLSDRDGGRFWGKPLYGPMLIVDPANRAVVANEPDGQGLLHPKEGVYTGTLSGDVAMGYTATKWAGKNWTMLLLPLPEDSLLRRTAMGHELFHRIEQSLGITMVNAVNLHMDRLDARILLQLEWRALAAALATKGKAQNTAIADALAFRAERRQMYGSAEQERQLEMAEGLAEYTGLRFATDDVDAARWVVISRLTNIDTKATFARTFIFTSVPAYGLLLDERDPGWRNILNRTSDLGTLLAGTLPRHAALSTKARAAVYGASTLRIAETERAARTEAVKARYRKLLVDGPTLVLPNAGTFNISFNTNELVSLDDAGPVYPTAHITDAWGTLEVSDGAIVPLNFSGVTVAAPKDSNADPLTGPGWTLKLVPGWKLVPGSRPGSFSVQKS